MEKKITLLKKNIYTGNLVLVNAAYPLKTFEEQKLVPADMRFPDILIRREAANVLQHILNEIGGLTEIVPVSGYRSMEEQTSIYEDSLRENGACFTRKYVALPNHSEHQTGLAIDLGLKKERIDFICPEFPYEGICKAFRETAVKYGFVERYPKGKERITGIAHEPWHFRYVGYPHSEIMVKKGFTLEEYIDDMRRFSYGKEHVRIRGKKEIELFYVPAAGNDTPVIFVPEESVCQISGNNIDGFIVTLWRNVK